MCHISCALNVLHMLSACFQVVPMMQSLASKRLRSKEILVQYLFTAFISCSGEFEISLQPQLGAWVVEYSEGWRLDAKGSALPRLVEAERAVQNARNPRPLCRIHTRQMR
ncbi:hypothetical protein BDP55DRAFT_305630 [Colletotrichum godetiae]|uniref:Secreted protein n=1 Tax=Colletotrichum godetiae TaxID=1209918 RepID=A0AAJ0AUS1_9PEZI|nr:uncharacterized protein BDP55DRAFT_305630 [Colletotrichum godetiae]KAK1690753.1 hypothetical protein BDP55DRAFT_305630 [Colletotrichum godetiae]